LKSGEDACFLTLGDPLLYSTYIYLLRELKALWPEAGVVTVPGITAFSAAAALAGFPVGEKKETVTIIPTADNLEDVRRVLSGGGTVILMKIGQRLREVLNLLEEAKVIDRSVFVSHAGMENERVESNLRRLRGEDPQAGYLSIILAHAEEKGS
jgi:precorrin-2/cobalt-factor-2 C20-methyltransferase